MRMSMSSWRRPLKSSSPPRRRRCSKEGTAQQGCVGCAGFREERCFSESVWGGFSGIEGDGGGWSQGRDVREGKVRDREWEE